MTDQLSIDALVPSEMAQRAESIGVRKANSPFSTTFALAILAGAFIALGGVFATIAASNEGLPYGINRLLAGLVFCLGLILVIVGGAELFTGNNLIVMAWASKKVSTPALLRNWASVYIGNFIGAVATALLMYFTRQYTFGGGIIGKTALSLANSKVNLEFGQAIALGIMCNALVCLAVWLSYSARSAVDKIATILFSITAFVAAGFEHSIANMYFVPLALFIKQFDPAFVTSTQLDLNHLTWQTFLWRNLVPVTLGNIIGGTILVAAFYWFIYLRDQTRTTL